jgi:hypothetical protein
VAEAVDRIALHLPEYVDVDRACHADRAVPQQVPDRLEVNALGEEERGAGVSKIMKMDSGHTGPGNERIKSAVDVTRFNRGALPRGEHQT